jgi:SNF2 family DNA or RNA helicase
MQWSEAERFTAHCIGLKEENPRTFVGDVRFLWPEAFHEFMLFCFPGTYTEQNVAFRLAIQNQIKAMYSAWFAEIRGRFGNLIDYDRPMFVHQESSVWRMLPHPINILSFEQGLGKTLTSATLSKILDIPRTVIIAPAGVKWNWFHDLVDDWGFNPLEFTILDAKPNKTRKAMIERFLITNFEQIENHWDYLMEGQRGKVGHIIIDEAHYIKNHNTRRHKACAALIDAYPDARVTLLTGTPIPNRVNDLFAYFKIAKHPLGFNQAEFIRRYIKKSSGGKVIGAENLDELRARYSNVMIRKKTEECVDLPSLIEKKHYLDESNITDEYKRILKEMFDRHREQGVEGESVKEVESQVSGNIHTLNRLLALAKAKLIIPIIDRLNEEGKKVVVFCTYRDALDHLQNHYKRKCVKIDGGVGSHERSQLIDRFTGDPDCMNFFGQNKAAGVGINLVNAQHLFFLNFPFTWDDIDQPKKRIHRLGQQGTCFINYMIVKGSIDEHIFNLFASKAEDAAELLDKGKKGVVDYRSMGSVQNVVFKQLMKQYADEAGITIETKFEKV